MDLLCIADAIPADLLRAARHAFTQAPDVDGSRTAGWAARAAKRNRQLDGGDPGVRALAARVVSTLSALPLLRQYARPARFATPLFSRYAVGDEYGLHVDDALLGDPPLRTDLAWTLFLSDPDDYDGGELVLGGNAGETPVKLPAGAMIVYDCGALHRVAPVVRGERMAAVGWIQSAVRDGARRGVLFTLDRTRRALHARDGDSAECLQLGQVHSQLLRMWADA